MSHTLGSTGSTRVGRSVRLLGKGEDGNQERLWGPERFGVLVAPKRLRILHPSIGTGQSGTTRKGCGEKKLSCKNAQEWQGPGGKEGVLSTPMTDVGEGIVPTLGGPGAYAGGPHLKQVPNGADLN